MSSPKYHESAFSINAKRNRIRFVHVAVSLLAFLFCVVSNSTVSETATGRIPAPWHPSFENSPLEQAATERSVSDDSRHNGKPEITQCTASGMYGFDRKKLPKRDGGNTIQQQDASTEASGEVSASSHVETNSRQLAPEQVAANSPQPAATSVKLHVVSICNNCTTIDVPFSNSQIKVSNPPLGYQLTDFSFTAQVGSKLTLEAPFAATANGISLEFSHWFSLTDQQIITASRTFAASATRTEEIAAVYDARRTFRLVRVQAIRLADTPEGHHRPNVTPAQFKLWVDKANEVLIPARIRLSFIPDLNGPDWLDMTDPLINKMLGNVDPDWIAERDRANLVASDYPDKLVVFFHWGPFDEAFGGGFSGVDVNFIAMPFFDEHGICGRPNLGLFPHEVGHYFGLLHTFGKESFSVAEAESYLKEEAGKYLPMTGDFTGDSKDDSIAFMRGNTGHVYVSPSNSLEFLRKRVLWNDFFSFGNEIPAVGDFDGNGIDDIVTFTRGVSGLVFVSLSDGTKFEKANLWHNTFCFSDEIPLVGDFDGDGADDIATFTRGSTGDVFVALSNRKGFIGAGVRWHSDFCFGDDIPTVGDVDGDGDDDIMSFSRGATGDVWVALSDRTQFVSPSIWHSDFCFGSEIPAVGDFNGDGVDDIATFTRGSTGDVFVALSDKKEFVGTGILWHDAFCFGDQLPAIGDFNGDNADDIAAFTLGNSGDTFVALSDKEKFIGTANRWNDEFNFYPLVFDGDALSDTEPDPLIRNVTDICPAAFSVTLEGVDFKLPRTNVMSYYHPNGSVSSEVRTLSQQQINRIRELLGTRFPQP